MIDLHLHTTASDGRSTPEALVAEAASAGIRTLAVTDHDTVAAASAVRMAAAAAGLSAIAGIEITAVHGGRDVHILGYFVDGTNVDLAAFLLAQRQDRRRRVFEIAARLDELGAPIDTARFDQVGDGNGRSIGRPLVAAALVAAGHVADSAAAFDRYLAPGRPAFIERIGATPARVIAHIHEAGGLASFAHPGKMRLDPLVPAMVDAGLDAIEVFHPDHGPSDVSRYSRLASHYALLITGGSDYHGPGTGRATSLGRVSLPLGAFRALAERARVPIE